MSVHYKFKSALEYDTVTFDGLHISVADLKKAILHQKKLSKSVDFDLQITNAQTKEVYVDDAALIAKNTSLIVARVPLSAQQKRTWNRDSAAQLMAKAGGEQQAGPAEDGGKAHLAKAVDLANLDASEEDKIHAMMTQSTVDYDPSNYVRVRGGYQVGEVPNHYRCHRCLKGGHWIKNCPVAQVPGEPTVDIKKSTGIPRSFMVPVDNPLAPGAMMTPLGGFAVPAIDHQAYKEQKKERPPFQEEGPSAEPKPDLPEDLVCKICRDLLTDAVMIPCCGISFCDECIRGELLESDEHECPECKEKDVSPETLLPNRFLRNSVNNFKNETGYDKRKARAPPPAASPEPPPPAEVAPPPPKPSEPAAPEPLIPAPEKPKEAASQIPVLVPKAATSSVPSQVSKGAPTHPPGASPPYMPHPTKPSHPPKTTAAPAPSKSGPPRSAAPRPPPSRVEERSATPTHDEPAPPNLPDTSVPPPNFPGHPAPPGVDDGYLPPRHPHPHHPPNLPLPLVQGHPLEYRPLETLLPPGVGPPLHRYSVPGDVPPSYGARPYEQRRGPPYEPPLGAYHMDGRGGGYRGARAPRGLPLGRGGMQTFPPCSVPPPLLRQEEPISRAPRGYPMDPMRNGSQSGIIDDPLATFNRMMMLRDRDERDRKRRMRRSRSYSRSPPPRRGSLSPVRRLRGSYSPRSSRSRSPRSPRGSPRPMRSRSRSPRPARSPLLPRSRSRSRSFSLSRSPSPRASPRRAKQPLGDTFKPKRAFSRSPPPRFTYKERHTTEHEPFYEPEFVPRSFPHRAERRDFPPAKDITYRLQNLAHSSDRERAPPRRDKTESRVGDHAEPYRRHDTFKQRDDRGSKPARDKGYDRRDTYDKNREKKEHRLPESSYYGASAPVETPPLYPAEVYDKVKKEHRLPEPSYYGAPAPVEVPPVLVVPSLYELPPVYPGQDPPSLLTMDLTVDPLIAQLAEGYKSEGYKSEGYKIDSYKIDAYKLDDQEDLRFRLHERDYLRERPPSREVLLRERPPSREPERREPERREPERRHHRHRSHTPKRSSRKVERIPRTPERRRAVEEPEPEPKKIKEKEKEKEKEKKKKRRDSEGDKSDKAKKKKKKTQGKEHVSKSVSKKHKSVSKKKSEGKAEKADKTETGEKAEVETAPLESQPAAAPTAAVPTTSTAAAPEVSPPPADTSSEVKQETSPKEPVTPASEDTVQMAQTTGSESEAPSQPESAPEAEPAVEASAEPLAAVSPKEPELLVPLPEPSRWEMEELPEPSKWEQSEDGDTSHSSPVVPETEKAQVTSEVLKRAENAIFKKAINAIRPSSRGKDRRSDRKVYVEKKEPPQPKPLLAEIIPDPTKPSLQVTIPSSQQTELRCVEVAGSGSEPTVAGSKEPEEEVRGSSSSSIRDRLGSRVDGRERGDRRPVDSRRPQAPPSAGQREAGAPPERPRSREERRQQRPGSAEQPALEQPTIAPEAPKAEPTTVKRKADAEEKSARKVEVVEAKRAKVSKQKSTEKRKTRTRSTDSKKGKKKDKKHKRKHKKPKPSEQTTDDTKAKKKEQARRKSTLDEAQFEPDYDAVSPESEHADNQPDTKPPQAGGEPKAAVEVKTKKVKRAAKRKESTSSTESESSSEESSSSSESSESSAEERRRARRKKRKARKKQKRKVSSSSSSESESSSDSEEEEKRRKKKKRSTKSNKKKKSKHR